MTPESLITDIHTCIATYNLIPYGSTVVIGLSGGPDSVVLTHILAHMRFTHNVKLIAAHLNHGWRIEADGDAQFCRALAQELGIAYVQAHLADFKDRIQSNGSDEALGRCARRLFFEQCAREHDADRIALAHHADDQQETFFIRMIRGTTLSGLVGIRPQHGQYVRPLLHVYKTAILAYLHEHGIVYRLDVTNTDTRYLRNNIRHTVLPALKACDTRFDENFERMITSLYETERFLDIVARQALQQAMIIDAQYGAGICFKTILSYDPVLRDRVIMQWLHNHRVPYVPQERFIGEIVRFLSHARGGTHRLHAQWHILKKHAHAYIQLIS